MKQLYALLLAPLLFAGNLFGQVTLTGTSYTEAFNNIGSGLPAGFFIFTSANTTSLGTAATLITAPTAWNVTSSGFKNYASATGLTASATATEQAASTNRALGVRQTGTAGTGGDPGASFNFQIANTVGLQNLQLTFLLQSLDPTSPRTTTWQVQYGIGANPTSFTSVPTTPTPLTTGNSTFSNTSVTANFGSALNNINDIIWIRIVALTGSTGSGARATTAIDDFTLTYSTFGSGNSAVISAVNDAAEPATNGVFAITLNTPAPAGGVSVTYSLSGTATAGADYTHTQMGTVVIAAGATTATIQIVVIDDQLVEPTETIIASLVAATNGFIANTNPAIISLLDNDGTVAQYYSFNTCSGSITEGFTTQNVVGAQVWACTTSGFVGSGLQMNGFSSGAQLNEDWLISPALNLSTMNIPLLAYWSRSRFLGNSLQLFITTNYTGDVTTTSWTELNGRFPWPGSDIWTYSEVNLSAFKQNNVRIAFRYTSNTSFASLWMLDEIYLFDAVANPAPAITPITTLLDFRFQIAGTTSVAQTFTFWPNDITSNLTLSAPAGFQLSKDGATFSNTITYTPAELSQSVTAYARFAPATSNVGYGGYIQFTSAGLNTSKILLKGNSAPMSTTLNVVNWNVEWFGSTATGQGPTDVGLQATNVKKVIEYLNADIYAFEEIVDTALFGNMIRSIGGYNYVISDYASSAYNTSDPSFATNYATGQKLAVAYKTSVVSNVSSRGLLRTSSTAISNWSTGRVPFLVNFTATKNGGTANFSMIVLHGKAGSTLSDYDRRLAGALELKDTLDAFFSTSRVIILGDFNDDLDRSIFTATGPLVSSYDPIIKDSVDADHYKSVTLPLSYAGQTSTGGNAEMIDHVVVSNEVYPIYLPYSATVYTDIGTLAGIASFTTTTSDHYPIMTRYLFTSTLPLKLLTFTGNKAAHRVKLDWTTTEEVNTEKFLVERSADGVSFYAIGEVSAMNNGSIQSVYTYFDEQPVVGTNYYRLRMLDIDGKFVFSSVVKVSFDPYFTFTVAPNPARGSFVIKTVNSSPVKMQIVDMNGRTVKEVLLKENTTRIYTHGLQKGIYVIKLLTDEVQTRKLIIE